MDIAPVYEFKSRLRAAAIAGTGLIKEDFRLARAVEGFKPLAGASPVFKRIAELSDTLLNDECTDTAGTLLDLLSLVDSVICTLGVTAVKGELSDLEAPAEGNIVINAPYSVLHELLTALTTSGSGHYKFLVEQHRINGQLFSDYRVRPALVKALGASYSLPANEAENWLCEQGKSVIPLLKKDFDPTGKREMARCVKVIDMISGAEENEFYLENLDNSAKDVKYRLIYALRHSKDNAARLIELCGKGKSTGKCALFALAHIDCDESIDYFRALAKKAPYDALEGLSHVNSDWACDLFADILDGILTKDGKTLSLKTFVNEWISECIKTNKSTVHIQYMFLGKRGKKIQELMRRNEDYFQLIQGLLSTLIYTADKDMIRFTEQWYNETGSKLAKVALMPALIIAKFLGGDCADWLREFLSVRGRIEGKEAASVAKGAAAVAMKFLKPCGEGLVLAIKYYGISFFLDDVTECERQIANPMEIIGALIDNADEDIVEALGNLAINAYENNCGKGLRQKLGDYFSKLVLVNPENRMLIKYLRCCGRTDFRGLTALCCEKWKNTVKFVGVTSYITFMSMSDENTIEEIMDVVGKLRSGELKCKNLDPDKLENWAHTKWNMP